MFGLPDTVHIFNWLQNRYKRQKTSKKWVLGRLLAFIKAKIVFTRRIFFIGQINANLSTFLASSNVFFRFFRSLGIRAKKLFCFIVGKKLLFLWRYHAKELNNVGIYWAQEYFRYYIVLTIFVCFQALRIFVKRSQHFTNAPRRCFVLSSSLRWKS